MKNIKVKIDEIANALLFQLKEGGPEQWGNSLYSGNYGIMLFFSYYLKYNTNPDNVVIIQNYMDECLDKLCEGELNHTFASGASGMLYAVKLLVKEQLLNVDYTELATGYEQYLLNKMERDLKMQNYDFLHGALGVGFYYQKNKKFIDSLIRHLENTAIKEGHNLKWASNLGINQGNGYNIALSHGMSSIAIVLAHMYSSGYYEDKLKYLIIGTVNYILSQEIDCRQYGSFFPSQSLENNNQSTLGKSRLAWCYGDLGIAVALWQCGNILKIPAWTEKALEVLISSTSRMTSSDTMVWDACVCHGTAGNAMVYRYMYQETGVQIFQDAYLYWIEETLRMAKFTDGFAGYKSYVPMEHRWHEDASLLEGIAGIGLVLLTSLEQTDKCKWMELFLLKGASQ